MSNPSGSSDPVPMNESVRLFLQEMTGVTLPEPCRACGWQYPDDVLVLAARRKVTLDTTPTHLCRPRITR
jgi:hypothetical protein